MHLVTKGVDIAQQQAHQRHSQLRRRVTLQTQTTQSS